MPPTLADPAPTGLKISSAKIGTPELNFTIPSSLLPTKFYYALQDYHRYVYTDRWTEADGKSYSFDYTYSGTGSLIRGNLPEGFEIVQSPEPASMLLMGLGGVIFAIFKRKRFFA